MSEQGNRWADKGVSEPGRGWADKGLSERMRASGWTREWAGGCGNE
jgi:hypothetical protein